MEKIAWGQTGLIGLIDIENGQRPFKQVYVENKAYVRSQDLKKPLKRAILPPYLSKYGVS